MVGFVHITDLVNLYLIVLNKALAERHASPSSTVTPIDPFERFYFGSVEEKSFGQIARGLAPLLHKRGLVDSPRAISVPIEEAPMATLLTARTVASRSLRDGWKPTAPTVEETYEEDIEGVLQEDGVVA